MSDYDTSLKILGLKEPFTEQDLKTAYRKLVKVHHPDKFTSKKNKEKATENFKKIQSAYEYMQKYGLGISKNRNNSYTETKKDTYNDTKTKDNKGNDENDENSVHDETVKNYRKRRQQRKKDFYYYDDFDAEKEHQTHPNDFEFKEDGEKYQQHYNQTHGEDLKNGVLGLLVVCVIIVIIVIMANGESEPKSNNSYRQNNRYERTNNNYYDNTNYQENYVREEPVYNSEPTYQENYEHQTPTEEIQQPQNPTPKQEVKKDAKPEAKPEVKKPVQPAKPKKPKINIEEEERLNDEYLFG